MQSEGCFYTHIFYPAELCLETDMQFEFSFKERTILLKVLRSVHSLLINDFDNSMSPKVNNGGIHHFSLQKDKIVTSPNSAIVKDSLDNILYVIEESKVLYREFYRKAHTELILWFDADRASNNLEFAKEALDFFINTYRHVSGDIFALPLSRLTYLSNVTKSYFHLYDEDERRDINRLKKTREFVLGINQFAIPFWNTQGRKIQKSKEEVSNSVLEHFKAGNTISDVSSYLLRAREELEVLRNYKYSLLETWVAIEVAVIAFLKRKKMEKGVSNKKLKDFESKVPFSYLINVELHLVVDVDDDAFHKSIDKINEIRKLRNDVVHKNKIVNYEDASSAFRAAIEFLGYLGLIVIK